MTLFTWTEADEGAVQTREPINRKRSRILVSDRMFEQKFSGQIKAWISARNTAAVYALHKGIGLMRMVSKEEQREIQTEILEKVVHFCDEHKLHYYLTGGTLIGAVRHKGFIPWDDDVDLNMMREDYDFFFSHFNDHRTDTLRAISIGNSDDFYIASGKVYDTRTYLVERVQGNCPIGVNIDIFPLDRFPGDGSILKRINREIGFYRTLLLFKTLVWDKDRSLHKNILLLIGRALLFPVSRQSLLYKISDKSQSYNKSADNLKTAVMSVLIYGEKEIFDISDFSDTVKLEFEGKLYDAPIGYDHVLRQVYGDYMELPPIEKRASTHKYNVYWRD